ncbi:MAG: DNA polymerase, partial [Candidatus Altiarchaeales archaeon]|nr:DNA polymerase [Candidatus Altiarchaeales archaeon]
MMETLLDADYTIRDDKVIVRLFYKTENGREIREVADFSPYFYAIPEDDIDKLMDEVKTFDRIMSVEKKTMQDIHGEIEVLRLNVKLPRDVPNMRGEIKELDHCREVREADIPFAHRYIIDSGMVPMENCEELDLRIATFDLEVYNPRGEPDSDRDEIIMISYADSMGLMRVWSTKGEDLDLDYVEVLDSELEVIKKFIRTVKEREIDIVTSYNGDNFDFPYLKDRGGKYGIEIDLGIEGSPVRLERRGMRGGAKIKGRPHVDMFPIARQVF